MQKNSADGARDGLSFARLAVDTITAGFYSVFMFVPSQAAVTCCCVCRPACG